MPEPSLLQVEDLQVRFPTMRGEVEAVSGVSFTVEAGETVAIVGESGSGKSVTALSLLGLLDTGHIAGGSVRFRGEDIAHADRKRMRQLRGEEIAMIFQNPMASLDPLYTVGNQIMETLRANRKISRKAANRRAMELLREVGIPDPERRVRSYPHQLSGGQRQRVMIAIALACDPALLIADEPTTALDVTVEAQILKLMNKLQEVHGTATIFITHDLGVVAEIADRVVVMYAGKVVEQGTVVEVLRHPKNPYTKALLNSIPSPDVARDAEMPAIQGTVPSLFEMPSGCRFSPRCPSVFDRCHEEEPPLMQLGGLRQSRCWLHEENQEVVTSHSPPVVETFDPQKESKRVR